MRPPPLCTSATIRWSTASRRGRVAPAPSRTCSNASSAPDAVTGCVSKGAGEEYQKYLGKQLKLSYYVYHESGELTLTTHIRLKSTM